VDLISNAAIGHHNARLDFTTTADSSLATEMNIWVKQGISADHHIRLDVGRRWINQRYTGPLVPLVDPLPHEGSGFGQLHAIIDTHRFRGIFNQQCLNPLSGFAGRSDNIG
jgi:hypothetical protein